MSERVTRLDRSRLAGIMLALAAFAACVLVATPRAAGDADRAEGEAGAVVIELSATARKQLRKAGVELTAKPPAERDGPALRIPVRSGVTGAVAQMKLAGQLRFGKRRGKDARLRRLTAVISADGGYVTGRLDGKQYTLLELADVGESPFDPIAGDVTVENAKLTVPQLVRQAVKARTGAGPLPSKLGTASVNAALEPVPEEQTSPPVRQRPDAAVDITSATLTWRARESWVDYLHDAPDGLGGAEARDGATDGPAETIPPSPEARVYEFSFPFAGGWYDEASGAAQVEMDGTVTLFKLIDPFQIDLDATAPEIELGGPRPRMIATLKGRRSNDDQQNRRAVIVDLDQEAVTPTELDNGTLGTTYTYEEIPALVPDGSDTWPIAGFYQPGSAWGAVSVSFTVGGVL